MRSSSAGRFSAWTFVAPVVLIAAVLVVVNVLQDATADDSPVDRTTAVTTAAATASEPAGSPGTTTAHKSPTVEEPPGETTAERPPRTYVVRPGDTLSAIAERFGTSAEELRALNPQLDPTTLQPGDRVRVSG